MNWCKEKNVLILETGKTISFDFPIKCIDEISDSLTIRLDIPPEFSKTDNSFCICKEDGTIKWKDISGVTRPPRHSIDNYQGHPEKCVMNWAKEDNILILENNKRISFEHPIKSVLETSGIIVVILDVPSKQSMTENVFGVSGDGEIIWQIERIPETATDPINRYTGFSVSSLAGIVVASNWNCINVYIDAKTGKVVDTEFTK